jgi:hypothetical protein
VIHDHVRAAATRGAHAPLLCHPAPCAVRFRLVLRDGRVFEGAGLRVGGEYLGAPKWGPADALGLVRSVLRFRAQLEVIIGEGGFAPATLWLDAAEVAAVDLSDLCTGCGAVIPRADARIFDGFEAFHFECAPAVNR